MTDPLREALAEALCFHRPPEVPEGIDHMVCNECQTIVRRVLSDPAVLAALARSGPDHSHESWDGPSVLAGNVIDRSGPAEGLREEPIKWLADIARCGEMALGRWVEAHRNEETLALTFHGADGPFYEGIRSVVERIRDYHFEAVKRAATPTASPTAGGERE